MIQPPHPHHHRSAHVRPVTRIKLPKPPPRPPSSPGWTTSSKTRPTTPLPTLSWRVRTRRRDQLRIATTPTPTHRRRRWRPRCTTPAAPDPTVLRRAGQGLQRIEELQPQLAVLGLQRRLLRRVPRRLRRGQALSVCRKERGAGARTLSQTPIHTWCARGGRRDYMYIQDNTNPRYSSQYAPAAWPRSPPPAPRSPPSSPPAAARAAAPWPSCGAGSVVVE